MKLHPAVIAALIMATVLVSGIGKMNIIHHEVLPKVFADQQTVIEKSRSGVLGWIGYKEIEIRIKQEIKDHDSQRAIIKALDDAKAGDLVIMYMAGFGGEVDSAMQVINAMKACKAHIRVIVEAPVYSGHAFISISGDELIMRPYSFLMFHTSSGYGTDCFKPRPSQGPGDPGYDPNGLDRTVLNSEHCQAFLDTHLGMINKFFADSKYLTYYEKVRILSGHDVYITSDDYESRINS